MLSDGLRLSGTSKAFNFSLESGGSLPLSSRIGGLFYLTGAGAGLYVYNGTSWVLVAAEEGGDFSGDYNDLINKPVLSIVATSGNYVDLLNRPTFATVATSGDYTDLINKPALAMVATSGSYIDLLNKPALATVATTGDYVDLINKPTIDFALRADLANAAAGDALIAIKRTDVASAAEWTLHEHNQVRPVHLLDFIPDDLHPGILSGANATDLAPYIQNALTWIKNNGGTLNFPEVKVLKCNSALTLIETIPNAPRQVWVLECNGCTLDFSGSGLITGSLLKVGASSMETVHEAGFTRIRGLRIVGPETDNVTVAGGISFPTATGNTIGLEMSLALDIKLEDIYIRRCYKGLYASWCWPINCIGLNCASNYIGIHLGSTCTLGTWVGCTVQNAAYPLVFQPDNDGDVIDAQTFIGLRLENSLRGITLDPRNPATTSIAAIRHITIIAPRFEQIAYDLLRVGQSWVYGTPELASIDRTNYTQAVIIQGGAWDDPVGTGTNYTIRSSSNGFVRGFDIAIPCGVRANINGLLVASRMFIQHDVNGGADSGNTYLPDGSAVFVGGNMVLKPRQTGWTSGSGSPQRGAFTAGTAGTASGAYQQTELQSALNRIAALEGRVLALQTDLETHGLIGP